MLTPLFHIMQLIAHPFFLSATSFSFADKGKLMLAYLCITLRCISARTRAYAEVANFRMLDVCQEVYPGLRRP